MTHFRGLQQSRFFLSTRDIDDLVTSDAILSDSFVTEFVTECPILSQLRQNRHYNLLIINDGYRVQK